jgi:DNA-binding transcriptional regulator LsrR (DeoR family)
MFNMIPEDLGDIANKGLVCDICGQLFDSVESLEQHREAEITSEEAGAGV